MRLFVVDDHALFLSGVKAELAEMSDRFEIVGTASDVDEAIAAIRESVPDVVLVDVHMPG
ncbi:MAG: response regulator, partial [Acidimicrobiia bacterium]